MLQLLHFLLFEVSFLVYLRNKSFCGERTGAVNIVNCCITSLMYETMIVLEDSLRILFTQHFSQFLQLMEFFGVSYTFLLIIIHDHACPHADN